MQCEHCKKKVATVHMTQIINNQKKTINLCEDCAKEIQLVGFMPSFDLHKLLAGFLNPNNFKNMENSSGENIQEDIPEGRICPNCGLSEKKFMKQGLLGCSQCYKIFEDNLEGVFRRVHGNSVHVGKIPKRTGGRIKLIHELNQLKVQLKELVQKEEFEMAAEIRDKIKILEKSLAEEGENIVN